MEVVQRRVRIGLGFCFTTLVVLGGLMAGVVGCTGTTAQEGGQEKGEPLLYQEIPVPQSLLGEDGYGGDVRIGDLNGDERADFVVFRSKDRRMKPSFLGAFTLEGEVLWQVGEGGQNPARPGPVAVRDLNGDGQAEVICFFYAKNVEAETGSMENVVLQVRDGRSGEVLRASSPPALRELSGNGPNWVHQRLQVATLHGKRRADDIVVKVGSRLLAFGSDLDLLWTYKIEWNDYPRHTAYIPAVGDVDGDGWSEITGGHYLIDEDGEPLWEQYLGRHMDSVVITEWDSGRSRVIASGYGQVIDADGEVLLRLGEKLVPHGQEVRVADFNVEMEGREMVLRYSGHSPRAMIVSNEADSIRRFRLNETRNNTGMAVVWWSGRGQPAKLYNGGTLWNGNGTRFSSLPGLPPPKGEGRMAWYHAIPANVVGDDREELVIFNPLGTGIWVFTPRPLREDAYEGYDPGPRQYNPRLMD